MNAFALALALAVDGPEPPELPPAILLGVCQFPRDTWKSYAFASEHTNWLRKEIVAEEQSRDIGDSGHNPRRLAYLKEWHGEADHSRRCWDAQDDVWRELCPCDGQTYVPAADRLYGLLGHDDYVAGRMPPAAPFHRFAWEK